MAVAAETAPNPTAAPSAPPPDVPPMPPFPSSFERMFERLDTDHDGVVTLAEALKDENIGLVTGAMVERLIGAGRKLVSDDAALMCLHAWRSCGAGRGLGAAAAAVGGGGDGPVAAQFMPPPDLLGQQTRERKDGFIYAYIRHGGVVMPSYGFQLSAEEAWHIVNFIRHHQKATPR